MAFTPNRKFKREYNKLFRLEPMAANLFLLIAELADRKGQVETNPEDLQRLMIMRFDDPNAYQLPGGLNR